jgi:uncharacterized BrkB/YihY/UPF0761 family membrane protein
MADESETETQARPAPPAPAATKLSVDLFDDEAELPTGVHNVPSPLELKNAVKRMMRAHNKTTTVTIETAAIATTALSEIRAFVNRVNTIWRTVQIFTVVIVGVYGLMGTVIAIVGGFLAWAIAHVHVTQ